MEEREIQSSEASAEDVNNDLHTEDAPGDTPPDLKEDSASVEDRPTDYAELAKEDLANLKAEFPELAEIKDICELNNPLRYAALRDLGLSCTEAYLATAKRAPRRDNRAHLSAIRTVSYAPQSSMSEAEMALARELFSDMSDAQIRKLYKKVNR